MLMMLRVCFAAASTAAELAVEAGTTIDARTVGSAMVRMRLNTCAYFHNDQPTSQLVGQDCNKQLCHCRCNMPCEHLVLATPAHLMKDEEMKRYLVVGAIVTVLATAGCSDEPVTSPDSTTADKWTVTKVVDGDTLWVVDSSGTKEKVRVIGIDTPESGECGFEDATLALENLIGQNQIELIAGATNDRDKYERLLRYVEVAGVDAGLKLLESGLAVAKYDSRDGYGAHPREDAYVAADEGSPEVCGR